MRSLIPSNLRVLFTAVLAALLLVRLIAASQAHIALVLDIEGLWYLGDTSQKLARWAGLPAGAQIKAAPENTKNSRIVILYQDNTKQTCEYNKDCTVKGSLSESSLSHRILLAAQTLFRVRELLNGDPDRYTVLGSRGEDFRDAVVALNAQTLDLAPVFANMQPGDYAVRLRATDRAESPPLEPVSFRWEPAQPRPVPVTGAAPGLYELRLLVRRYGQLEDTGQHAWVLLADAERYAALSESFAQAVKITEEWRSDVDREVVRSFLRAYLDHLTTSETK
jgi:hypothetical protein